MASPSNDPLSLWKKLTWDDLSEWTGDKTLTRGKSYARNNHVSNLSRTADGMLLAWVQGTHRYATHVRVHAPNADGDTLTSECSCPVGLRCKHAVAVILKYLDVLKANSSISPARENDPRWGVLQSASDDEYDEEDEYGDEDEDEYVIEQARRAREAVAKRGAVAPVSATPRAAKPAKPSKPPTVREFIESQPVEQLRSLLLAYSTNTPAVKKDLEERAATSSGDATVLIRETRKEMRKVTAEDAWYNHWNGEGNLPDYSGLSRRFTALFEMGQYDALLDLGRELLELGTNQIEQSHDEGETSTQIQQCLGVVFRAVPLSALANPDKLLYVFEMTGEDEYDLTADGYDILDGDWSKADWSAVADVLLSRLGTVPSTGDEWARSYRRDRATNAVIRALENAGREAEATKLCEDEVRRTGSYERLVSRLLSEGRDADAERWAKEGIEKTQTKYRGIADHLRGTLQTLAAKRKDHPTAAAFEAEKFFEHPGVTSLKELLAAAKKAGCEAEVKAAAMHFLESGVRPKPAPAEPAKKKGKAASTAEPAWPLPKAWEPPAAPPDPNLRRFPAYVRPPGPHFDVLIDLALSEKRPADALAIYDRWVAADKTSYAGHTGYAPRVADAVADTHPDRAVAVYKRQAEALVARTSPSAYQEARTPLKKIRDVLTKQKRADEWTAYLAELRAKHARKSRFLEVLDGLGGKKIVDG